MSTNITQYSQQYAQGMVNAEVAALVPKIAELIHQETETLKHMSKATMDAVVGAATQTVMSSLAQAGSSLAGAAAGGINTFTGGTALKAMMSENTTFMKQRNGLDELLNAADKETPTIELKKNPTIAALPEKPLADGEHSIGIQEVVDPNANAKKATEEAPGKAELERQRDKCIQDHKHEQKALAHKHDTQKSTNQLAQYLPETLAQATKGNTDKRQAEEQGKQGLLNQATSQEEAAIEKASGILPTINQMVGDIQGYSTGMTR